MTPTSALLAFFSTFTLSTVSASTQVERLDTVYIYATQKEKELNTAPVSVKYLEIDDIQLGNQQLGVDEALIKVPGLFVQNRYNFAQDLRLSIRGFGSRSTFGIRGIKIFVDKIPATLPDGQSAIDNLDISSLDHIEVVRTPSSSIYGPSAGGIINMYTEDGPESKPFFEIGTIGRSYNYRKNQIKAGGQADKLNYFLSISKLELDGYREHSKTRNLLFNSKFRYDIDNSSDLTLTLNALDSPEAQDPGGLTNEPNNSNTSTSSPQKAQKNNISFDAGESVKQQQLGIIYNNSADEKHSFSLRNYYILRNFEANLPFGDFSGKGTTPSGGMIELDRFFVGGGGVYNYKDQLLSYKNKLTLGFDIDQQKDNRVNFTNIIESDAVGPKSLDQDENILNWGVYFQNELFITKKVQLNIGARYDEINFDFIDHYLDDNTDDSGNISFSALSPNIGLIWNKRKNTSIYSNINTSFETPSSREFANPTSASGFNSQLDKQESKSYEVGIRNQISPRLSYDVAIFLIKSKNELTLAGENPAGSSFFSNTGKALRKGVEFSFKATPLNHLHLSLAYTYSNFKFVNFSDGSGTSYKGNYIPGIPAHTAFTELSYIAPSGFYFSLNTNFVDNIYTDNSNSYAADSYSISNLRMGQTFYTKHNELNVFFGVNNIFDESYIGAVRVNEANKRFFEPSPTLNGYIGLSLRYN